MTPARRRQCRGTISRVAASKDTFEVRPVAPTLKDQEDPDGQA